MKSQFLRGVLPSTDSADDELVTKDLLTYVKSSLAPCQPNHPYLVAHGIQDAATQVYVGTQEISGKQYHGAIAVPIFDIDGQKVSILLLTKDSFTAVPLPGIDWDGCFVRIGTPSSDTLLILTDYASGMSAHMATGHAAVVAIQEENLAAVSKAIATKFPDKKIIICDDLRTTRAHTVSMAVAEEMSIHLALPYHHRDTVGEIESFNALLRAKGRDAVQASIQEAMMPGSSTWLTMALNREVVRLSLLSEVEYEQQRTGTAKTYRVRAQFIDKMIAETREKQATSALLNADAAITPYPEAVDGKALLHDLVQTIRRFTILTSNSALTVALWTIFTYIIGRVSIAPILGLISPVKRCGKTTLLTLVERLCYRPLTTSNITAAALFRCIQLHRPTLLIDEGDTFIHASSELNGIINSGHSQTNAYVIRVVDGRPVQFSTFCAKVIALIGRLPETMQDRTIPVQLRRKRSSESVESIREASDAELNIIKSKIQRWTDDNAAHLVMTRPVLDGITNDRVIDNWEPLLAIAKRMGDQCLAAATAAAISTSSAQSENRSVAEELLADVQNAFESACAESLTSTRLIELICIDEEKPWATYARGRAINARQVAGLLAVFGIASKNLRMSATSVLKGYEYASFADAFERYLGSQYS